jgi:hydrogenase nickel incorporation protein HypA/HybF
VHELSLCLNLIDQLNALARKHGAVAVARVEVQVGALCGVEAQLLEDAFTIAKLGTCAEGAELVTQVVVPGVECRACGAESDAVPNDLSCPECGSLETALVRGQALILARVQMVRDDGLSAG